MPPEPMMMGQQMGPAAPASAPTANPGLMADSLSKVREAVRLCELALPGLPVGSEEHKSVMGMITAGAKVAPSSAMPEGVQTTQLQGLQESAQKSAIMQALMRNLGGQGAGGGMPPGGGQEQDPMSPMAS